MRRIVLKPCRPGDLRPGACVHSTASRSGRPRSTRIQPAGVRLVGRGAERDVVLAALADPHRQGVLVCGPAGVGKSRQIPAVLRQVPEPWPPPGRNRAL